MKEESSADIWRRGFQARYVATYFKVDKVPYLIL